MLSRYQALARDVTAAGGDPAGLFVVAPDVAPAFVALDDPNKVVPKKEGRPRSFPVETKAIQQHFAEDIDAAIDAGMTVIIPVQVGPDMAARAVEVMQRWPAAHTGCRATSGRSRSAGRRCSTSWRRGPSARRPLLGVGDRMNASGLCGSLVGTGCRGQTRHPVSTLARAVAVRWGSQGSAVKWQLTTRARAD